MKVRIMRSVIIGVLLSLFAITTGASSVTAGVINTSDRGWYQFDGAHEPGNTNYVAGFTSTFGYSGDVEFRDFFVFDLSGINNPLASASLRVFTAWVTGPGSYSLFDVGTSLSSLTDGTGGVAAFNDLGTGTTLGTYAATGSDDYQYVTIPLNTDALSYLNTHLGETVGLGGRYVNSGGDVIFGASEGNPADGRTQLVYQEVSPFVPPGLNPGDHYQLAFVTRDARDATSSDINDYHAFVQEQADLSSLTAGITWKAIGSTVFDHAYTNAPVTASVYNLNGDLIATDFDDFWDAWHPAPIGYDQFGDILYSYVWTGTDPDGTGFYRNELGRGEYGYSPVYGISSTNGSYWVGYDRFGPYDPALKLPLYALSEVLVVPETSSVPEPSTLALLASFAAIYACSAARKRILSVHTRR